MKRTDTEMANLIGSKMPNYVKVYKENNTYVVGQTPDEFGLESCRCISMSLKMPFIKSIKKRTRVYRIETCAWSVEEFECNQKWTTENILSFESLL